MGTVTEIRKIKLLLKWDVGGGDGATSFPSDVPASPCNITLSSGGGEGGAGTALPGDELIFATCPMCENYTITWTVSGDLGTGGYMSTDGHLHFGNDAPVGEVVVSATATCYTESFDLVSYVVTVVNPCDYLEALATILQDGQTIIRGNSLQLTVIGTSLPVVSWGINAPNGNGWAISSGGLVTVDNITGCGQALVTADFGVCGTLTARLRTNIGQYNETCKSRRFPGNSTGASYISPTGTYVNDGFNQNTWRTTDWTTNSFYMVCTYVGDAANFDGATVSGPICPGSYFCSTDGGTFFHTEEKTNKVWGCV